jgi:hypothetical protein
MKNNEMRGMCYLWEIRRGIRRRRSRGKSPALVTKNWKIFRIKGNTCSYRASQNNEVHGYRPNSDGVTKNMFYGTRLVRAFVKKNALFQMLGEEELRVSWPIVVPLFTFQDTTYIKLASYKHKGLFREVEFSRIRPNSPDLVGGAWCGLQWCV